MAGLLVVLTAATLATLSRGTLVGLLVAVVWAAATKRISLAGTRAALAVVVAVVALGFSLWGPQLQDRLASKQAVAAANVSSRRALWSGAVEMWADHPLTGVGPGRFGTVASDYVHGDPLAIRDPLVHNTYLRPWPRPAPSGSPPWWRSWRRRGTCWRAHADAPRRRTTSEACGWPTRSRRPPSWRPSPPAS